MRSLFSHAWWSLLACLLIAVALTATCCEGGSHAPRALLDLTVESSVTAPDWPSGAAVTVVTPASEHLVVRWPEARTSTGRTVNYRVSAGDTHVLTDQTSAVLPGLARDTEYVVSVTAVDSRGEASAGLAVRTATLATTQPRAQAASTAR